MTGLFNRIRRFLVSKKNRRLIRRFSLIVCTSVVLYTVVGAAGVLIYGITRDDTKQSKPVVKEIADEEESDREEIVFIEEEPKYITNVAVFGVDKDEMLTDVIFVVSFNSDTKDIHLVSVPRDTQVIMTDEMIDSLTERNRSGFIPYNKGQKGLCKINAVHGYAGDGYRTEFAVMMLEDLLNIDIDYTVKFTTSTFRYVVDAVGGVEFDVPMNMYYSDPEQGLYINLNAGVQVLNGDKAEQLVRFRAAYAQADLQRIRVQQDFMTAMVEQVLNTETIIKNLPAFLKMVMDYVETDATIMDVLKYVKYVDDIDMNKITMQTIPGEGGSYFIHDEEGTRELVESIFYYSNEEPAMDDDEIDMTPEELNDTGDTSNTPDKA